MYLSVDLITVIKNVRNNELKKNWGTHKVQRTSVTLDTYIVRKMEHS